MKAMSLWKNEADTFFDGHNSQAARHETYHHRRLSLSSLFVVAVDINQLFRLFCFVFST